MTASLHRRDVVRQRLARQFLTTSGPDDASDVVRALGAVQSQDYAGAKWALAQRTRGCIDAEVERAFADGRFLRTHVLRPTWHFVAPDDIRWMLALTAPRVRAAMAHYDRKLELTPRVYGRSSAAIERALAGGRHLQRNELARAIEEAGVKIGTGQRLGHLVMRAELDALICSGPRRGKQFTYALLEERVLPSPPLDRDHALLELARRYFATRGPATAHDFAWWSGLTMSDVKRALQIGGAELEVATLDGQELWFSGGVAARAPRSAHLLPNYDEYFIAYKDRRAIAHRLGHLRMVTGGNALLPHAILIDGQLVGAWKRRSDSDRVVVELTLHAPLTPAEHRRLATAARRLGEFLGSSVDVRSSGLPGIPS